MLINKLIIASVLAIVSINTANAVELSVVGGYDFSESESVTAGVGLSETYGKWNVAGEWHRNVRDDRDGDRVSLTVSPDLGLNVYNFPVLLKAGVVHTNITDGRDGYAWLVGVGTRYSVAETLTIGADYRYYSGENDIRAWDGNHVFLSLNHKF